jgi:hypothetical protein
VEHGQASWARFYLEPVQDDGGGVDEAVRRQVGARSERETSPSSTSA